jgi:hypothetical protein
MSLTLACRMVRVFGMNLFPLWISYRSISTQPGIKIIGLVTKRIITCIPLKKTIQNKVHGIYRQKRLTVTGYKFHYITGSLHQSTDGVWKSVICRPCLTLQRRRSSTATRGLSCM